MCADTGAVVSVAESGAAARIAVFLASGETLLGSRRAAVPPAGGGRSELRVSTMAALFTAPAHVVPDEPGTGRQVPVSLAVTVEPAGVPVTLPGRAPETVVVARVFGELGVGSVLYRLQASGWVSSADGAGDRPARRARAVFQDRSAAFLTSGSEAAAALMRHTEIRPAPLEGFATGGPERGPAHTLRCAVGGRSPALIAGELRDTEQHLTAVEAAPDGGGWTWWSAAPFVFVRSGVTGLGLVEKTFRAPSARPAPPAPDLPDPY